MSTRNSLDELRTAQEFNNLHVWDPQYLPVQPPQAWVEMESVRDCNTFVTVGFYDGAASAFQFPSDTPARSIDIGWLEREIIKASGDFLFRSTHSLPWGGTWMFANSGIQRLDSPTVDALISQLALACDRLGGPYNCLLDLTGSDPLALSGGYGSFMILTFNADSGGSTAGMGFALGITPQTSNPQWYYFSVWNEENQAYSAGSYTPLEGMIEIRIQPDAGNVDVAAAVVAALIPNSGPGGAPWIAPGYDGSVESYDLFHGSPLPEYQDGTGQDGHPTSCGAFVSNSETGLMDSHNGLNILTLGYGWIITLNVEEYH